MQRTVWVLALLVGITSLSTAASALTIEEIELRKRQQSTKLGFGFLGIMETSAGLNRDRPEVSSLLFAAPQLKIGDKMRLRLNMGFTWSWLDRQENPWDLTDISLQFGHLAIYKERHTGINFSGYGRWYFPTSKASRNSSMYGQARLAGRAARRFGPVSLSVELNGQKYFHKYTTWNTEENPGSAEWIHSAGKEDYTENNTSFGFGETFTGSYSPLGGLDLSLIWSFLQSRHYQPGEDHSDRYGSTLISEPRITDWSHSFRFVADATYGLGALPWLQSPAWKSALSKMYLSFGYFVLAPQLQNGGHDSSFNPFNAKYAQVYFDLMVVH